MTLTGQSIIGFETTHSTGTAFQAFNPQTGQPLEPSYHSASPDEVERAVQLAARNSLHFANTSGAKRAELLRSIAAELEKITTPLTERAHLETALPLPRLQSELARTCNQLRLFARVVEEGSWVMARIDHADRQRTPLPKPDVRSMLRPLGPVVVFGASNFPLAYSVAGGDTASALATGNPVIVKAHPAHPGTSELTGRAVAQGIRSCGFPEGIFSLIFDSDIAAGQFLVKHPLIKAAGFTGSLHGGRALMDLAAARPEPIPVFAEMGSTNPVFIFPRALASRTEQIASGLYGSFTLGGGQFCTKPGLIFVNHDSASDSLAKTMQDQVSGSNPFCLLTAGIRDSFVRATNEWKQSTELRTVTAKTAAPSNPSFQAGVVLMETEAATFLSNPRLAEEIFGPVTLLVKHSNKEQLFEIISNLKGHLTATVHGTDEDFREFAEMIRLLETKVGRLIFNGYPTGLEVCDAIIHGGPYPATSDGRSTSVGSEAIFRFARPVCFQDCPSDLLPAALKDANPLRIWRMVDGQMTQKPSS